MLNNRGKENLKAILLGVAFFLMVVFIFVFGQDLSSSQFIYVDF